MPIRRELRPLYPPHWRELSRRVRFERAPQVCANAAGARISLLSAACRMGGGSTSGQQRGAIAVGE
jgi:hypothetical protein